MKAYISADLFRIAMLFTSTEETRYYLQGVYVEPHPIKGLLLTATDGHRLFNVWDTLGEMVEGESGIVSLSKDMMKACKSKNGRTASHKVALYIEDGKPQLFRVEQFNSEQSPRDIVQTGELMSRSNASCLIDGTYPDWRRVVPQNVEASGMPWFDGHYLADFQKANSELAAYYGQAQKQISITSPDAGSPAIVRFAFESAFAVLMPMRGDDVAGKRPRYLDARPYVVPHVTLSELSLERSYSGNGESHWVFSTACSTSELTPATHARYKFPSRARAARAYNRVLSNLQERGLAVGKSPVLAYETKPAALLAFEAAAQQAIAA